MKNKINRLIWDIETSPCIGMFWRPGWKVSISHDNIIKESAIICICYKWEGEKKVHSLEWNDGDDKALCEQFLEIANQADELIAHNGDKFDLPWLQARCIYHGLDPTPIFNTVDTLVIARRRFKFNSNRLDYLGKHLLGEGKIETEFGLWKAILLENCSKAMAKMVRYCKKDVELLERVWHKLQPYHKPKTHVGRLNGRDKWTCPFTGSENVIKSKTRFTAAGARQHQMYSKEANAYYTISERSFKDYIESKNP
jgi:predicted PolB exonuclease-like 3'-5' exonuclease